MFNDLILDKMKKVFEYIATLLLLLAVGTSCEEGNDNWKVITAVPTGLYINGAQPCHFLSIDNSSV